MTIDHSTNKVTRAKLRKQYRDLYDRLAELFFKTDPIRINFGDNTDEYEPEVETILPRLQQCTSELECLKVIHEEFVRWFDVQTAGPISNYETIARQTWLLWNERKLNSIQPPLT
jgi:hypothetical protein